MLRKQLTARSILVLAFSWVVFGTSEAANAQPTLASETCARYASPSGSDANAGTAVRPVRSAQKLANSLAAGETGCMYAGSYPGNLAIASGGITLTSVAGERALLLGYVWIKDSADGVTLADLDIDGHAAAPITVQVQGDGALLRGLDITNRNKLNSSYTGSCLLLGVVGAPAFDPTIERSRIHNCGGGNGGHDHAIYSEFARRAVIRNNYLYDNPGFGISMYPDTQSSLIEHNVIDGNAAENRSNVTFSGEAAGGEYSRNYASSNDTLRRNVIANALSRYNVDSYYPSLQPTGNLVALNCVWNAPRGNFGGTDAYTLSGNIAASPLYVDRLHKDFRLQAGSPCSAMGPVEIPVFILDTFLTAKPARSGTSRRATFRFASTVREARFQCRLDGGAWRGCLSPKTYLNLARGLHRFAVRAVNPVTGRIDVTPALWEWRIR